MAWVEEMAQFTFQSPQWGSNSKAGAAAAIKVIDKFQSPQWGSNSKVGGLFPALMALPRFSPLNGEVILKNVPILSLVRASEVSVPSMGK